MIINRPKVEIVDEFDADWHSITLDNIRGSLKVRGICAVVPCKKSSRQYYYIGGPDYVQRPDLEIGVLVAIKSIYFVILQNYDMYYVAYYCAYRSKAPMYNSKSGRIFYITATNLYLHKMKQPAYDHIIMKVKDYLEN